MRPGDPVSVQPVWPTVKKVDPEWLFFTVGRCRCGRVEAVDSDRRCLPFIVTVDGEGDVAILDTCELEFKRPIIDKVPRAMLGTVISIFTLAGAEAAIEWMNNEAASEACKR